MKKKKIKLYLEDFGLDSFLETPTPNQLNMIGGTDGWSTEPIKCVTDIIGSAQVVSCVAEWISFSFENPCPVGTTSTLECSSKTGFESTPSCCPPPPSGQAWCSPPPSPPPAECAKSIPFLSCNG